MKGLFRQVVRVLIVVDASLTVAAPMAPEARIRGAPLMAPAMVLAADAGVTRTEYLLRHVSAEIRAGVSVLLPDFGGAEGDALAGLTRSGRTALIDADARDGVFPLGRPGHLTLHGRSAIAEVTGKCLREPVPWGGVEQPLFAHIEQHARDLAIWIQGGAPLRALRMRW